ncbi:MAG: GNAT family N-acetyltransferase [Candidatus Melainabacteria bacterium]
MTVLSSVNTLQVLSDPKAIRAAWEAVCQVLPLAMQDPYYHPAYLSANRWMEGGEVRVLYFYGALDGLPSALWYPVMLRPLPSRWGIAGNDLTSAYGFGGPVITGNETALVRLMQEFWPVWCAENDVVAEFTRFHPLINNHQWMTNVCAVHAVRDVVWMDLSVPGEQLWQNLHPQKRRYLRKAQANGLTFSDDWQYFDTFKSQYAQAMADKEASPFYRFDDRLFDELRFCYGEACWLHTVLLNGEPVSTALFLHQGETIEYFLGANNPDAKNVHASAYLLFRTALKAKDKAFRRYMLGGGLQHDDSLFRFKQQLSPHTATYYIGMRVYNGQRYEQLKTAVDQWLALRPESGTRSENLFFYRTVPE